MTNNESTELYTLLHRLERQMHRVSHWAHHDHEHGHEHGHYREVSRLLRLIAEHDGIMQRDLAEEMDVRPSSMTEMLTRLEARGLLVRKSDEKDQRVMRVSLTEEGRRIAEESGEAMEHLAGSLFHSLTGEEISQMLVLTRKLCEGLDKEVPPELDERMGWRGGFPERGFDDGRGPHCHGHGHSRF